MTAGLVVALSAVAVATERRVAADQRSAIRSEREARREDFDWGTLYTYYDSATYGTRDGLAAVAVIKPGREIHPPHQHAEEEFLMVVEGEGTWSLAGRERPARKGDMQYAAPWDLHGIRNTGRTPLRFVVWKWNGKGIAPMAAPSSSAPSSSAPPRPAPPRPAPPRTTEVYAVRYGTLRGFPVAGLVAGADTARRADIALTVWLVRRPDGRTVLVDAGFYREKFMTRWKPADYQKPSDAVRAAGIRPEDVTDLLITHVHWDHLDGADLFPNARLWIQRDEYAHHVDGAGRPRNRTIDSADATMLADLHRAGRVQLIDGDAQEVLPGLTVYTGGRHTHASQYAAVRTDAGTVVLASDNAYLYENLATRTPIAQTLDSASNRRAQERMLRLAGSPRLVVPGHDPAVFVRFPKPGRGVARIE